MHLNPFTNLSKGNRIYYLSILLIIFLFLISEYLLFKKGFYAISADESLHTLEAYKWYIGQTNLFSVWLPFQKILYPIAFYFHYDLFLTPRIISGFFGLLTLLSLIDLSFQLFLNRIISLLTGFFGAIFLPIYLFSVLPLEEINFFFFTIFSITFYLRWLKNNKNICLWISVISSCIGTTTRYESWLFAFALFIMFSTQIINQNRTQKNKILFISAIAFIFLIFPGYWIYLSYLYTGKITGFIMSVKNLYKPPTMLSEITNNVLFKFFSVNIRSLNIIGIIPIFYFYKTNKNVRHTTLIFGSTLLFFSAATFLLKAMPTHNHWRLAMVWSLFLVPYTSYCLYYLLMKGLNSNKYLAAFIVSFFLLLFLFNIQTIQHRKNSYFSWGDLTVGRVMERLFRDNNSKAYISSSKNWYYANVMIASQSPNRFITNLTDSSDSAKFKLVLNNELLLKFKKLNVRYLVLKPYIHLETDSTKSLPLMKFTFWNIYILYY